MGTQQAETPARQGGSTGQFETALDEGLPRQLSSLVRDKNQVQKEFQAAQLMPLVDKVWQHSLRAEFMTKLSADVGFYLNEDGFLPWNLTRLPVKPKGTRQRAHARRARSSPRASRLGTCRQPAAPSTTRSVRGRAGVRNLKRGKAAGQIEGPGGKTKPRCERGGSVEM